MQYVFVENYHLKHLIASNIGICKADQECAGNSTTNRPLRFEIAKRVNIHACKISTLCKGINISNRTHNSLCKYPMHVTISFPYHSCQSNKNKVWRDNPGCVCATWQWMWKIHRFIRPGNLAIKYILWNIFTCIWGKQIDIRRLQVAEIICKSACITIWPVSVKVVYFFLRRGKYCYN